MSVKENSPEWFNEESEANQAYLAGIERGASEAYARGFATYSTYLSRSGPTFFDKMTTVIRGVGFDFSAVTPGTSEESVFVIFKRRSDFQPPADAYWKTATGQAELARLERR